MLIFANFFVVILVSTWILNPEVGNEPAILFLFTCFYSLFLYAIYDRNIKVKSIEKFKRESEIHILRQENEQLIHEINNLKNDQKRQEQSCEETKNIHPLEQCFIVLGIMPTNSTAEIKKAYRILAQKWHPDKGGNTKKFQQINDAYMKIMDFLKA